MTARSKIRIAEEIVIEWLDRTAGATCPNCGRSGEVTQILDIDFRPPDRPHRFVLQVCPTCTVRFVDNTHSMDYGHEDVVELGWQTYQVQQGAGIWPIVGPLMRVPKGPGARVLEIGGGYGFGLDFCTRARGWQGEGYDPSLLSAFGRDELGLTVHQGYFGAENLADGPWDVLIATEVIEHVIIPPEFLRLARAALGKTGILVLTTPDAEWIEPKTSADRLMPLLSPGVHVVLQTASSLAMALRIAGFAHVQVERDGMSLIAYASAAPFTLLDDASATRAAYRHYLIERALISASGSDLALGFAGRGLFEAANDGDAAGAAAAWAALVPAVQARFGLDLDSMAALPAAAAEATLADLLTLIPLNLGMICFARAMDRLAAGLPRTAVARLLHVAGEAVAALQTALAKRSITDALYVVLGPLIADEILIGQAEAGEHASVAPLAARGGTLAWRGFVGLVNAGAYMQAAALRQDAALTAPPATLDPGLQRDAWLSLANLGLSRSGDTALAVEAGNALGPQGAEILRQAFVRLVNAADFAGADSLAAAHGLAAGAPAHADAGPAFVRLALGTGDAAGALAWLDRLTPPPPDAGALRVQIFIRLVNEGAFAAAAQLAAAHDIAAGAATDQVAARDAGLALALLALAHGDPASVPGLLPGLGLQEAEAAALLGQAFIRLVNGGRYDDAQALAAAHEVSTRTAALAVGMDVRRAEIALALNAGDPADAAARLTGAALSAGEAQNIAAQAVLRLVNAARFAEAAGVAASFALAPTDPALAQALALIELQEGDAARVPVIIAACGAAGGLAPEAAARLCLAAFTRLVSAGRLDDAQGVLTPAVAAALEAAPGEEGRAARLAAVLLDLGKGRTEAAMDRILVLREAGMPAATLGPLAVEGFVRLVNEAHDEPAAALWSDAADWLFACPEALRHDALAAHVTLMLRGVQQNPFMALEAAAAGGVPPARLEALAFAALVTLVNRADYEAARRVLARAEAGLIRAAPPLDDSTANAMFAAGMLFLQDKRDWRRAAAMLARLRDGLTRRAPAGGPPDPLFWPALRAEIIALNGLARGPEAGNLLKSFIPVYPPCPEDLLAQVPAVSRR
jgi:hypothetical protein